MRRWQEARGAAAGGSRCFGDDDDDGEEEEDLLGNNGGAETADFSSALDDKFSGLMGGVPAVLPVPVEHELVASGPAEDSGAAEALV